MASLRKTYRMLGIGARQAVGPVVDLVCPPTCWAASDTLESGSAPGGLDDETRWRIGNLAAQNYCFHCGLTLGPYEIHDARDPCGRCGKREVGVVRVARVGTFSEPLITLVHRLKFERSWELARILAPFVYQSMVHVSEACHIAVDALVPVPLHWSRRIRRGFNQSEEISREVMSLSKWPAVPALKRIRRTSEQARIDSPTRRIENMRSAFLCAPLPRLAGKHIWLVDDVSTTGATLHAAASAIRKLPRAARPASINAAVVCVTDHQSAAPPLTATQT